MIIYNSGGTPIIRVEVDDSSYAYRAIMSSDEVRLEFALTQHVELPIGSYITFQGVRYDLLYESNVRIVHNRDYEYVVTFHGPMERAKNYVIHNPIDKRLNFPLIAKPHEHLQLIIDNLNERDGSGVWQIGDCIGGEEVSLGYNHTYCLDGLSQLASACNTEWEITRLSASTFSVSLRKVEYNRANPIALGYGRNQGFVPGVERVSSSGAIQKVWIQGGDRNISLSEYGASMLHLPASTTIGYDGVHGKFSDETGYSSSDAITVVTDSEGYSVSIQNAPANATEGSLDLSAIYPKREGTVSGVCFEYDGWYYTSLSALETAYPNLTDEDWDSVQVDIYDATVPASLDYMDYMFDNGEPFSVAFQTGGMTGREFDVQHFYKEATTQTRTVGGQTQTVTRPANRFELVKTNIDGVNMPKKNYLPASGNKYIVYNCYLPDSYVESAEREALREACAYLYDNKDTKRTYKGSIDGLYAKRNWSVLETRLVPGSYISFSHTQVQPTPIPARIVGMRQYINNPESPEIEISNETVSVGMSSRIQSLRNDDASIEYSVRSARQYAKRGFRDAKETAQMLVEAALSGYTNSIDPITVHTMQALVGDESLQFDFVTSLSNMTVVDCPLTYNSSTKKLVSSNASYIKHSTLGKTDLSTHSSSASDYKRWEIDSYESPAPFTNAQQAYYVYVKVPRAAYGETGYDEGTFAAYTQAVGMTDSNYPNHYHFLLGILNSEFEDDRSFVTVNGFTEILPGRVTTERVVSSSGTSYFDLLNNAFKLGDLLKFNVNGSGQLVLNGTLVQTGSGATAPVGAYCGTYSSSRTYQKGDEVSYTSGGATATYRYKNDTPSSNKVPTNTTYWELVAQGKNGTDGDDGATPTIGSDGYWYINGATTGVKAEGEDGQDGQDGKSPASPYRGEYSSSKTYYGNDKRTDVVYYNGAYYIAKTSLPNGQTYFSNHTPSGTSSDLYWSNFGASFESIATGFIEAVQGTFKNAIIQHLETYSVDSNNVNHGYVKAEGNWLAMYDGSDNLRLKISGDNLGSAGTGLSGTISSGQKAQWFITASQMNNSYESEQNTTVITIASGSVTDSANTLSLPALNMKMSFDNFATGSGYAYIVAQYTVNGNPVGSSVMNTINTGQSQIALNLPSCSTSLPVNSSSAITIGIRFNMLCEGEVTGSSSEPLTITTTASASWSLAYIAQKTEIGANGFRVMFTSDSMFQAVKSGNYMELTIQSGDYGIKVNSSGVQIKLGSGQSYQTISKQLISGYNVLKVT